MSNQSRKNNKNGTRKGPRGKAERVMERDFSRDVAEIRDGSRKELSRTCQNYLKAIVDTRNAPKVGVPTLAGGMPGRTAVERYTQQLEVSIGTNGVGWIHVGVSSHAGNDHDNAGPYSNANVFTYTGSTYTGTTYPLDGSSTLAGVTNLGWSQSPHSIQPNNRGELQYRPVGATITVFPESSFLDQNGRIALLEAPGHVAINGLVSIPITTVESYPEARVIRGTQSGAQSEKVVLNWHPTSGSLGPIPADNHGSNFNDYDFVDHRNESPTSAQVPEFKDMFIAFFGAPSTQFHVEVTGMYEMRGLNIPDLRPRVVDSRGMDLVANVLAAKMISGYVGKPEHVYESYLAKAWTTAKKTAGWLSKHEQELINGAGKALEIAGGFI